MGKEIYSDRDDGKSAPRFLFIDESGFPDFDWKTYLDNYPDLRKVGIDSEQKAMTHWLDYGRREGRTYGPLRNKQDRPSPEEIDYKWNISIFSIFQNDAPFLKEWIEFHKLIGVEHFFLYNNLSTDDYKTVLRPYIESGEVDLIDWPFRPSFKGGSAEDHMRSWIRLQMDAITDCFFHRAKKTTRWFCCLDTDEFIFPVQSYTLKEFLEDFTWSAGVVVNWIMYGSSRVASLKENELLIEKLLYRAPDDFSYHYIMKSIVRTAVVLKPGDPHQFIYLKDCFSVTPDKEGHHNKGRLAEVQYDKLRINHYYYRTENFWNKVKRKRNSQACGLDHNLAAKETKKLLNSIYDPAIIKYLPELKKRMGQNLIHQERFSWSRFFSRERSKHCVGVKPGLFVL